jgi:hypothetical protein
MKLMLVLKFTQKIQRGYIRVWFRGVVNVFFKKTILKHKSYIIKIKNTWFLYK